MKLPRVGLALIMIAGSLLGGCASTPKAEAKKAGDDEYVTLPPKVGSNLPRRVKKSDLLAGKIPNADTSSVGEVDKEEFARSIHPTVRSGN